MKIARPHVLIILFPVILVPSLLLIATYTLTYVLDPAFLENKTLKRLIRQCENSSKAILYTRKYVGDKNIWVQPRILDKGHIYSITNNLSPVRCFPKKDSIIYEDYKIEFLSDATTISLFLNGEDFSYNGFSMTYYFGGHEEIIGKKHSRSFLASVRNFNK